MSDETCPLFLKYVSNESKDTTAIDKVAQKFSKLPTQFEAWNISNTYRDIFTDGINNNGKCVTFIPNVEFEKLFWVLKELVSEILRYKTTDEYKDHVNDHYIRSEGEFLLNEYTLYVSIVLKFITVDTVIELSTNYNMQTGCVRYGNPSHFDKKSVENIKEFLGSGLHIEVSQVVSDLNFEVRRAINTSGESAEYEIITNDSYDETHIEMPF